MSGHPPSAPTGPCVGGRLLVVTHAATLAADHRHIGFLWNGLRAAAGLREIVGDGQDRACLRGIEDALAKRVVLDFQSPNIGSHRRRVWMCSELAIGRVVAEDIEIAIAEAA